MIELKNDALVFTFPEVHPDAALRLEFQRTLRIPDDEGDHPLPPGSGPFPSGTLTTLARGSPRRGMSTGA